MADAHALALATARPVSRVVVLSGATPFEPGDLVALKADAPALLRLRAPALVQRELGWTLRFGFEAVLQQLDDESPEVLPAGFLVAEPGLWLPGQAKGCR